LTVGDRNIIDISSFVLWTLRVNLHCLLTSLSDWTSTDSFSSCSGLVTYLLRYRFLSFDTLRAKYHLSQVLYFGPWELTCRIRLLTSLSIGPGNSIHSSCSGLVHLSSIDTPFI
jgi:hypothetical protein